MRGPTEFDDVTKFRLAEKVRDAAAVACISDYCRSHLLKLAELRRGSACGIEGGDGQRVTGRHDADSGNSGLVEAGRAAHCWHLEWCRRSLTLQHPSLGRSGEKPLAGACSELMTSTLRGVQIRQQLRGVRDSITRPPTPDGPPRGRATGSPGATGRYEGHRRAPRGRNRGWAPRGLVVARKGPRCPPGRGR